VPQRCQKVELHVFARGRNSLAGGCCGACAAPPVGIAACVEAPVERPLRCDGPPALTCRPRRAPCKRLPQQRLRCCRHAGLPIRMPRRLCRPARPHRPSLYRNGAHDLPSIRTAGRRECRGCAWSKALRRARSAAVNRCNDAPRSRQSCPGRRPAPHLCIARMVVSLSRPHRWRS